MVHMKIRPKDLIGQDRKMVRIKICPKDLIGQVTGHQMGDRQKKAPEDISLDRPIRARFQKTRNQIVQSDYSGRTNKSDGPIRALPTDHLPY